MNMWLQGLDAEWKKMDGDHNIHHLANELCYSFLLGAPK
jgi:hypothetical protein